MTVIRLYNSHVTSFGKQITNFVRGYIICNLRHPLLSHPCHRCYFLLCPTKPVKAHTWRGGRLRGYTEVVASAIALRAMCAVHSRSNVALSANDTPSRFRPAAAS